MSKQNREIKIERIREQFEELRESYRQLALPSA